MTTLLDSELQTEDSLPFDKRQQSALLGYLLIDKAFFYLCKEKIKPSWFLDSYCQKIWQARIDFDKKNGRFPKSMLEFQSDPYFSTEDAKIRNRLFQEMTICQNEMTFYGRDVLENRLQDWLQATLLRKVFTDANALHNKKDLTGAIQVARLGMREIDSIKFKDDEIDFSRWQDHFLESQKVLADSCTFGVDMVDRLLNPAATGGSLLKGDMTVILAPVNVGKTTCMITVTVANLLKGKDVLFILHEGTKRDIWDKLMKNIMNMNQQELQMHWEDPIYHSFYNTAATVLKERCTFVPMIKGGLTIEEVDSVVRSKVEERKAKYGKGFDLIVSDYGAVLTTVQAKGGQWGKRNCDDAVYGIMTSWGEQFDAHVLTAIQANREGSKVSKGIGPGGKRNPEGSLRLLVPEDVAESFGPIQRCTNVITMNRGEKEKANNKVVYYIGKSRSSETDMAIVCGSRFDLAKTHDNAYGATWYRGAAAASDRLNDLLASYKNREVPADEFYGIGVD